MLKIEAILSPDSLLHEACLKFDNSTQPLLDEVAGKYGDVSGLLATAFHKELEQIGVPGDSFKATLIASLFVIELALSKKRIN